METSKEDQYRAEQIIRRFDKLKSDRGTYNSHVQDVAERVVPRKSYVTVRRQKGAKTITFNSELFDATAVFANQYMAAGLVSHLCPPNSRWHALKLRNEELNKSEAVKESLAKIATILHEELAASNFYMQINELCLDLGWAGMGCLEPMKGTKTALNFKTYHISEYYIAENSDRMVDTIYYKFKFTARQAEQEWGRDNLGKSVSDALTSDKKEDMDKEFWFIEELRPRAEYDKYPAVGIRRAIASTIVGMKDKNIIAEDGFYDMPKLTPRWLKNTNEVNGRSQGMFALPWIKLINQTWKNMTQAIELGLRPPTLTPDDGFIGPIRSVPGAFWHYRASYASNPDAIRQLNVQGNTKDAMEYVKWLEMNIKKAFFNDLFVMLAEQTKAQTAYEISQRIEEKHTMIVPPIGRLQSELFNGLISRCIGILGRAGRLRGIIAPELIGQEYEIQYISKLALALRILETRSVTATYDIIAPIGERSPQVFDNYDEDKIARGVGERMGMPPDFLRSETDVEEIRDERAALEQAMQAVEMATEAAKAAPGISKKVEEGSVLAEMAGAVE